MRSSTPACETAARIAIAGLGSRRVRRQGRPRGSPERELPSGRVPHGDDAREIERRVELLERVDCRRDVEERLRPPASRPDAPVLEVPRGEAVGGEVDADPLHQRAVVLRAPVPAVHDDGNRMRPGARGEEELHELARVGAVGVRRSGHAPGRIRTCGLALRRRALYPLSYGRGERPVLIRRVRIGSGRADRGRLGDATRTSSTTVFSSTIAAKAWFATAAVILALVQVDDRGADLREALRFLPERGRRSRASIAGRGGSPSCARSRSSSTA